MFMLAAATTGSVTRRRAQGRRPGASTFLPPGTGSQTPREHIFAAGHGVADPARAHFCRRARGRRPVSYTHLTLPTIYSV